MRSVSLPPWGVALAVAATAPFVVKLFGESLEKRKKQRTEAFLSKARAARGAPKDGAKDADVRSPPTPRADGSPSEEIHVAEAKDPSADEVRRKSWHD